MCKNVRLCHLHHIVQKSTTVFAKNSFVILHQASIFRELEQLFSKNRYYKDFLDFERVPNFTSKVADIDKIEF